MATSTDRTNDTRTILFIDSDVSDYQSLLVGLDNNVEVHLLNSEQDGVLQIEAALQGRSGLDSIQIISHGSSGSLSLGSSVLNNSNLNSYTDALRQIGSSLTATGDILLYGCDVAQGNAGVSFVNQLANLTGADVAASNDLTGNSALGGDWNLEVSTGKIEAKSAISPTIQEKYTGALGNTIPVLVTDGSAGVAGVAEAFSVGFPSTASGLTYTFESVTYTSTDASPSGLSNNFTTAYNQATNTTWTASNGGGGIGFTSKYVGARTDISANDWTGTGSVNVTVTTQGVDAVAATTETADVTFVDLAVGESLTIGGLTATATTDVTAANVAAGFAGLTSGATTGNIVSGLSYSGSLTGFSSTAVSGNGTHVVFTSVTPDTNVTDLVVSVGNTVIGVNHVPTGSVTISGTATQGQTLTASNTLSDDDGIPTSGAGAITYLWQKSSDGTNWTNINVNTSNTLFLTQGEAGQYIRAVASYTDNGGTSEKVTSTETATVAMGATVFGGSYADTLEDGTNISALAGGLGNDTYIINNSNTQIIETSNGGKDSVISSVSYTLPTYVENLTLTGTDNINATGNNTANILIGNSGNNRLDGRAGIDTMQGGEGDDTYIVDNVHDVVYEDSSHGGGGTDTVISSVTYTLPPDVENLTLTGRSAINGTGNNLNNVIIGSAGNNKLLGGDGNDSIFGGAGNDKLIGGAGADTLDGGSGKNVYIYNAASDSTLGSVDNIIGRFDRATADTIQLNSTLSSVVVIPSQNSGLSSSGLTATSVDSLFNSASGTAATKFTNSKVNVAILTTTDSKTFFAIDINGDGAFTSSDMLIDMTGSILTSVTPSTFKLISTSPAPVPHITLTASATSVDEGSTVTYTVTFDSPAPSGGLNIPYTLSGTATNSTDYTGSGSTGTISISAGQTIGTLTLNAVADHLTEGAQTIIMTLGTLSSSVIENGYGTVTTIINDTSVTIPNTPPTATNLSVSETYTEDTPLNLTDIVITDTDSPNVTATLALSNPTAGSLNTSSSNGVTSTYDSQTGVWTASGAIADVNALLAGLTFTPAANFNGNFTVSTSVSDNIAAPITGSKSFTGTAVNDAPTLTAFSSVVAAGDENTEQQISLTQLQTAGNGSDVEDSSINTFVVKAVSTGSLKIGTSSGTATAWDALNNTIDATYFAYWTPAANAKGSLNAFTVVAKDSGGAESITPVQATVLISAIIHVNVNASGTPVEGGAVGSFNFVLDNAPATDLVVNYNLTGSSAILGTDYNISAGTNITNVIGNSFTIAAGQTTGTLTITALADSVIDPNETVKLNLVAGTGYQLAASVTSYAAPSAIFIDTNTGPVSITSADFNNDGKLDFATANWSSNTVSVKLGDGNGGFSGTKTLTTGGHPTSIITRDFNKDGKQDLAVANYYGSSFQVYLGNGDGSFISKPPVSTGSNPYSLTTADFNGDGKLDMAIADNGNTSCFYISLGDGAGNFATPTAYPIGANQNAIISADFNGDGKPDIATANVGNTVKIFLNDGSGVFSSATSTVTVGSTPYSIATADFNGDGKLDFATADMWGSDISVRFGNGDGTFSGTTTIAIPYTTYISATPNTVIATDYNNDGNVDIVVVNGNADLGVLYGDGHGNFSAFTSIATVRAQSAVIGDFNNDGKTDFVIASNDNAAGNSVYTLLNNSLATTSTLTIRENTAPTGNVAITGSPTLGQTLTAGTSSIADADGLGSGGFSYQWKADNTNISGATSSTLALSQNEVGKAITVTVSYTDGGGTHESLTSSPTNIVANSPLSMGTTTNFDFTTDQTTNFIKSGSTFSWSSGNGDVTIPLGSDEIWTLNQATPAIVNNDTYTVSAFVHNDANNGCGGLGFSTNSSNSSSTGAYASPGANSFLGVSFHGGGGNFLNDGIISTNLAHPELVTGNWYKAVFSVTETSSSTFNLILDVYNASSSSAVGSLLFHTVTTVNNSNVASTGLYPYFATEGSRLDSIDNFAVTLSSGTPTSYTISDFLNAASDFAAGSATVDATGATPTQIDNLITYISNVSVGGITGSISLTAAQFTQLGAALNSSATLTVTDTSVAAATLMAMDTATTGVINANSVTSLSGTGSDILTVLGAIKNGTITDTGLSNVSPSNLITITAATDVTFANNNTTISLADVSGNVIITKDTVVPASNTLKIDGSALTGSNFLTFDGNLETDGKFSVTGGSGSDQIIGGAGADTITSGGGNDTLTGGAGSDTFNINAGTATITDFDVGSDTLNIGNGATAFVSTISTTADYSAVNNGGILDITVTTAGSLITGSSGSDSITVSSGANTLTGGGGSDLFVVNAGTAAITDFVAGTDGLLIANGATAFVSTASTADYHVVGNNGILAITVTAGGFTTTGSAGINSITGSAGADTIIGGDGGNTIIGNGGNDMLVGGIGADSISGGGGSDTIVSGGGADSISAGSDNDVIDIMDHTALASIVTLDGGDGNDTLDIVGGIPTIPTTAGDIVDADFAHINNIENLMIESTVNAGTITLGSDAADAGITMVDASQSGITKIDASSDDNDLTILGGAATSTIIGGTHADVINVKDIGATINGGAGNDTINLMASHSSADTIVLGTSSTDTITNFVHGTDIILLGGTTGAVAKTVAQIAATTESASVTLAGFSSAAVGTITIAGLTVTSDGSSAYTATEIGSVLAGGSVTGLTLTGTVSGYTVGSNSNGTIIFTSTTAATNVTDLSASITGAGVAPTVAITQGGTVYAGVAHEIIFDTTTNLGTLGVSIGDQRAAAPQVPHYAVASDTGAIYYDSDGNWTDGDSKQIGTIGVVSGLSITNFTTA